MRRRATVTALLLFFLPQCQAAVDDVRNSPSIERREAPPTDDLRQQVSHCWTIDLSIPGLQEMVAEVRTELNPDGSVASFEYGPATISRLNDPNYRKFAESARRAVLKCSPLRIPEGLPYESWKQITFVFSAKEMLGQ